MRNVVLLMLAVLMVTGCAKQPKQAADVDKLMDKVRESMAAGQTNTAITTLTTAMEDKEFKTFRTQIYNNLLSLMISIGRGEEAKTQYLAEIGRDDELVRTGFGMLGEYSRSSGEESFQAWITALMGKPALPRDLVEQVFSWQLGIYQSKGQMDQIIALIPVCKQKLDAATAQRLLQGAVTAQIDAQKYENAHILLDTVEKEAGSDAGAKYFADSQRMRVLFLQGRWDDGKKKFSGIAAGLTDDQLASCFSQSIAYCNQKEKYDLVKELCEFVLDNQKDKPRTRGMAANQLISQAKARKDTAAIPVCLESLKAKGIPAGILFDLTWDCFYTVVQDGSKEQLATMVGFADKLTGEIKDTRQQAMLKTFVMDGSFVLDDHDRVVKILEEGIEGRDKNWHEMVLDKARAHQALKAGKSREAVDYFRKFMTGMEKWYKPDRDPCSGLLYSKEMCLGFNAKRIGDILDKAGDAKSSEAAYEEAREYYRKALADLKADSDEAKHVNKELAAIPAKKGQ